MRISRFAFLVAVLATFLPQSAEAQYVWTGQGTGWQGQVTPPYGGSAALVFGNSIYPLVSLTPFTSVGSISLEGGNDISFSGTTNLAISGTALGSLDNQQGDFYFGSGINLALSTSTTFNVGDTLEGYERLRALAPSPDHIVPGHDPLVMQIYPPAKPELKDIAVRLDVQPSKRLP